MYFQSVVTPLMHYPTPTFQILMSALGVMEAAVIYVQIQMVAMYVSAWKVLSYSITQFVLVSINTFMLWLCEVLLHVISN